MIWALWAASVAVAFLLGQRARPRSRKVTPRSLRNKADWWQDRGYRRMMKGCEWARLDFDAAMKLRTAAHLLEQQMLEDLR